MGGSIECDECQKGENSIALEYSKRKIVSQKFLTWEIRSIRVSAEERSCLEGVYTAKSDRWAGDESEKKL